MCIRDSPSCLIGSAIAGGLSMAFGCTLRAPHGGLFVPVSYTHLSWGYESSSFGKYRMAVVMHGAANGAALLLNVVLIKYL